MTGPQEFLPPDAPATVDDVRAARRWTWVAIAWAVAASIVGVLALIQSSNDNSSDNQPAQTPDVAGQLRSFEKQTNDRLDQFGTRLDDRAADADLQKLDKKLSTLEDDLAKVQSSGTDQAASIKQMQADLDDLTKRVEALEQQQGQSQTP